MRHGKGSYYTKKGDEFMGFYVNDLREGHGVYYFNDGKELRGVWRRDAYMSDAEYAKLKKLESPLKVLTPSQKAIRLLTKVMRGRSKKLVGDSALTEETSSVTTGKEGVWCY